MMEENKNIEVEEKVQETVDEDFADIDKETIKKNYIIVGILYFVVVILSILLVIGIKNQKDTIKDKIDNNKENTEEKEDNIKENVEEDEVVIPNETPKEENIPNTDNNEKKDDELSILDQI